MSAESTPPPVQIALPASAGTRPVHTVLAAGESVLWCSCGLSSKQPFCDGSHRGTSFLPVRHVAKEAEERLFCTCKQSKDAPFCDGAHNNVTGAVKHDDEHSPANRAVVWVEAGAEGIAQLDGGCYVRSPCGAPQWQQGTLAVRRLIGADLGAQFQSQFLLEAAVGHSPVVEFGDRHVALFVAEGRGTLRIGTRSFALSPETGAYIRPGERFQLQADQPMGVFASVCPLAEAPVLGGALADDADDAGDASEPRTVPVDPANRQTMGERFFQMLVDRSVGSTVVTQFIGEIPLSKAMPHRHLYEESLIVLRGEGCLWTETRKARVCAGDIIFLPRRQLHSLQCTDPAGMLLVGVIYPGDNPSISY